MGEIPRDWLRASDPDRPDPYGTEQAAREKLAQAFETGRPLKTLDSATALRPPRTADPESSSPGA